MKMIFCYILFIIITNQNMRQSYQFLKPWCTYITKEKYERQPQMFHVEHLIINQKKIIIDNKYHFKNFYN